MIDNSHIYTQKIPFIEFEDFVIDDVEEDKIKYTKPNDKKITTFIGNHLRNASIFTRLIILSILLFFTYLYMLYKKKDPYEFIKVIVGSKIFTLLWVFTISFCIYLFLLPDNDIYVVYLKKRAYDGLKAYIIALLAYYELPFPVFWVIFFYDSFFIKQADAAL